MYIKMSLFKKLIYTISCCVIAGSVLSCSSIQYSNDPSVLVFSKTKGWVHSSIPAGVTAIQKLGDEYGFQVDTTKDASYFTDEKLRNYRAVIFCNTTGDVLNPEQQAAFERYIQAGGGYVGIHSAADTEYEWPWYAKLMGAHFASHPSNSNVRTATIEITDKSHPATTALPDRWERTDEWYNYRSFYHGIKVLANLDENTYAGGTHGADHPIAWYHAFDGGRAFYTGGGHTDESYSEPLFLNHLLAGIQYAMGEDQNLNYEQAYSVVMPEENRFVKTVLVNDLNTPMTLDISDDGRIFYTELRTANLYMYDTKTGRDKLLHRFDVATKGGTGLIGVTIDPDFASNQWIYLYYSPPTDEEPIMFNLSRFTLKADNSIDLASEKVLLQVPVQENSGAHHGGALAWDKQGNLYLSTGDSSSPFPSNGYAPIDERPGNESLDAQRSAANTNDLKGKVLRITPQKDGTYTIPEGNLFPVGMDKTRPEIYTMGLRNPYRIAVNPKTSVLYWGEIGPDAGKDSIQGPRGYDEFNQAKAPGNFGWPYFVGKNYAYADWDFSTETAGPAFNPDAPVNNSPNNTGLTNLPPTNPPMIWYPYAASEEFPELGQGGRSAMAGEFYSYDENSSSPNRFPEFYDGTLFVMEWMRNWVMALRFDENENFLRAEPFMTTNGDFRRPIDLTFGKDGMMYMLEYGSVYGADNDDARLVKIEYNTGNRAPIAQAGIVDTAEVAFRNKVSRLTSESRVSPLYETAGQAPLTVPFTSRGSKDLDNDDQITFQWLFDGKTVGTEERNPVHRFTKNGEYNVILKVSDQSGLIDTDTLSVKVGNTPPEVAIVSTVNKSFFWEGSPFAYKVQVTDPEDGKINSQAVEVYFNYNPDPGNLPQDQPAGHQEESLLASAMPGNTLIANSDCKACHTVDQVSVGPAYQAVAQRYKGTNGAVDQLAQKIINGGAGNWGTTHVMSAHPQISTQDAKKMVEYILSMAEPKKELKTLPLQGSLKFNEHVAEEEPNGRYTMLATYTDQGGKSVGPLIGRELLSFRNARVKTAYADAHTGFSRWGNSLGNGDHKAFILLKNIDLTGIKGFTFEYTSLNKEGEIEVRIDSQEGDAVTSVPYQATGDWDKRNKVRADLNTSIDGRHDVYFMVIKPNKPNEDIINLSHITMEK
ncbi:ThuA domain-containing protein [Catalinimonas niigatensis]|uniref:ThuA domain-containing protein n=1 Tax=Catalinimonas niigatensis TaxID=1397264 RepID=UPI002665EFCF|nr:ThuA domain-containing protein [Catalinimonas niigatensis]WPP50703.1 ThuA domain-containing protein [Catalinimonas niigatensis]